MRVLLQKPLTEPIADDYNVPGLLERHHNAGNVFDVDHRCDWISDEFKYHGEVGRGHHPSPFYYCFSDSMMAAINSSFVNCTRFLILRPFALT